MKYIDGQKLKSMLLSGSNNLYNHYPEVDALNVFPVPDGDTGMNMNLTLTSGSKEIENRTDKDVYTIAKSFSRGLLMGARGNSGVITSQIFRGFADALQGVENIDITKLAEAFDNGRKVAYKAVSKPVEGTILTVIRESSDKLMNSITPTMSLENAFEILIKEADASLKRTPNLLPVLKEVGVVDSGGAGLLIILEGMYDALKGKVIERNLGEQAVDGKAQVSAASESEEFGYCTEFILRLGTVEDGKRQFNKTRFTSFLNSHGNSLVVVQDEDIVKVHVHTLKPGNVFNYAQQFGEFLKLKCENMTEQHNEILLKEIDKEVEEKKEPQEYALIATSSGKGIDEYFNQVGVNYIVSGGQSMNPSTNDFLKAIEEANAKHVYIFPNNGNIILAANQAKDILEGKVDATVIPTKTIPQGITGAMNFNPELPMEDNLKGMLEAIKSVKSGAVTYAIRDTDINGVKVKKDEFLALKESKDIVGSYKTKIKAFKELIKSLVDEDSSLITVLAGEDVKEKEFKEIKKFLEDTYKDLDLDIRVGNQPVYSFLIGVE